MSLDEKKKFRELNNVDTLSYEKKHHERNNDALSLSRKLKKKQRFFTVLKQILLIAFALVCIYPVFWVVMSSFKADVDLFRDPWGLPTNPTWENYKMALVQYNMPRYFLNSVIISLGTVAGVLFFATITTFGLTRLRWKLSKTVMALFLAGLMIPAYGCLIPLYGIMMKINLLDTRLSVIITHVVFGLAEAILILSGFFVTIPTAIEEAAVIDGCSAPKCLLKVDMPIVAPGLVTIGIITFIGAWNDLLYSQIYMTSKEKFPITIGLSEFAGVHKTDYAGMMAAISICVIPVVIVYLVFHKYIMEGMIAGAVKG